jgi:tight adherence protein B
MSSGLAIFLALLGGAVFLLSQALIVPAFGDEARMRKLLRQRLKDIEAAGIEREAASLLREKYLRELPPFARVLEDMPAMAALSKLIEQAGRTILAHRLVALSIVLGFVAAAFAWGFTSNGLIALAAFAAALAAPYMVICRERKARFEKFEEQLPDAIDVMKRALRAGHPFNSCLKLVAEDMDQPIAREFHQTFSDVNYGTDLRRALLGLLLRVPSTNVMALVTAVLVQKETGGNLAEIFEGLAKVIRGRFRFQRKVRTLSAEGRLSAWILALVPIILFAVIWITTPDYMPPLLHHPVGRKLVIFGCVSMVLGVLWMRKIIRIDI